MYKGFKLKKINFNGDLEKYLLIGRTLFDHQENVVKASLDSFFFKDKSLDSTKLMSSWFPQIEADVFISHSHNDKDLVIALAGWLNYNFGITSFIDSCVWGYAKDLNIILDNEFSWLDKERSIYNYNKVLDSTSHVHMMLSTALSFMIDKTECLIFFDTPNSIKPYEKIDKTESPWLYFELAFSQMVKIRIPERVESLITEARVMSEKGMGQIEKSIKIKYNIYDKHLIDIDANTLNRWTSYPNLRDPKLALDNLYDIVLPPIKFI